MRGRTRCSRANAENRSWCRRKKKSKIKLNLSGKVALVTGGTKGIGASTAIALAKEGANIGIVGRHLDDDAKSARAAIIALGRRCEIVQADCGQASEATRCVRET